ncbi:MAG: endonuclease/exonuclease/phosphatase family protein [Saprospiraceae bacterium]
MKPQSNKILRTWNIIVMLCTGLWSNAELHSQTTTLAMGFYNLENLFDTIDDTITDDIEFTPTGAKNWTPEKYADKLKNMARVISSLENSNGADPLVLLGVSEIENRKVLEDLIQTAELKDKYYKIVHFDSPDLRGVDVALLYKPKYFTVLNSRSFKVPIFEKDGKPRLTRDILLVKGKIGSQNIYVFVNHWPSRRGGEEATREYRVIAAKTNKMLADSIRSVDPDAGILIMGDLNDNPDNASLISGVSAKAKPKGLQENDFLNPFYDNYIKGEGSTAYQDAWSLFDQILISKSLLKKSRPNSLQFFNHKIFRRDFMMEKEGHFKNYPKRTFSGNQYIGGYSDHFPVLCYFRIE